MTGKYGSYDAESTSSDRWAHLPDKKRNIEQIGKTSSFSSSTSSTGGDKGLDKVFDKTVSGSSKQTIGSLKQHTATRGAEKQSPSLSQEEINKKIGEHQKKIDELEKQIDNESPLHRKDAEQLTKRHKEMRKQEKKPVTELPERIRKHIDLNSSKSSIIEIEEDAANKSLNELKALEEQLAEEKAELKNAKAELRKLEPSLLNKIWSKTSEETAATVPAAQTMKPAPPPPPPKPQHLQTTSGKAPPKPPRSYLAPSNTAVNTPPQPPLRPQAAPPLPPPRVDKPPPPPPPRVGSANKPPPPPPRKPVEDSASDSASKTEEKSKWSLKSILPSVKLNPKEATQTSEEQKNEKTEVAEEDKIKPLKTGKDLRGLGIKSGDFRKEEKKMKDDLAAYNNVAKGYNIGVRSAENITPGREHEELGKNITDVSAALEGNEKNLALLLNSKGKFYVTEVKTSAQSLELRNAHQFVKGIATNSLNILPPDLGLIEKSKHLLTTYVDLLAKRNSKGEWTKEIMDIDALIETHNRMLNVPGQ